MKVWITREKQDGFERVSCPKCREEMSLHIPDMRRPERVLATCECCGGWYLVSLPDTDTSETLLVHVPAGALLHKAAQIVGLNAPLA